MRRLVGWRGLVLVAFAAIMLLMLPYGLALAGEDVCIGAGGAAITAGPALRVFPPRYTCTRVVYDEVSGLLHDTGAVVHEEEPWGLFVAWLIAAATIVGLAGAALIRTGRG